MKSDGNDESSAVAVPAQTDTVAIPMPMPMPLPMARSNTVPTSQQVPAILNDPLFQRQSTPLPNEEIGFKSELIRNDYSPYPPQILELQESNADNACSVMAVETLCQLPDQDSISPKLPDIEMTDIELSQPKGTDQKTATLLPAEKFDAASDAKILYDAMKSFISNKNSIISVLCNRSEDQRLEIKKTFKQSFGVDLIARIRAKTSGKLKHLLEALLTPSLDFCCQELFNATVDSDTDENVFIEMLFMTSNQRIKEVQEMFEKLYYKSLVSHINGNFKGFLTAICKATRDESDSIDHDAAELDARQLSETGFSQFQEENSIFENLFTQRNFCQLKLISDEYRKLAMKTMQETIEREFDDEQGDALISIIQTIHGSAEFFARRLHMSMHGFGINDRQLTRLIVAHCEVDLVEIKTAFEKIYEKTLKDFVKVKSFFQILFHFIILSFFYFRRKRFLEITEKPF